MTLPKFSPIATSRSPLQSDVIATDDGDTFRVLFHSDGRAEFRDAQGAQLASQDFSATVQLPPDTVVEKVNWGGLWKACKAAVRGLKAAVGQSGGGRSGGGRSGGGQSTGGQGNPGGTGGTGTGSPGGAGGGNITIVIII